MISFLKGFIEEKSEKSIFLDVNGVGYEVYMPTGSASQLPSVGEEVKIHTYLQISENGIGLYGFLTKDELNVFKLLITVNGIGPKVQWGFYQHFLQMSFVWQFCQMMIKRLQKRRELV